MSKMLCDTDIRKLISGGVINGGDPESVKPNSYVLRLGNEGEFITVEKRFKLGDEKKCICIAPGHSAGLMAQEGIDLRAETVQKIFPGCALHAFISPTTDLSREGIVAPTTQVDAGFYGSLCWTINNTSSSQRKFFLKDRIFRITFFLLEESEVPEKYYEGEYQGQFGYASSQRTGLMEVKDHEIEDCHAEGDADGKFEELISRGYPWNLFGPKLQEMKQQYESMLTKEEFERQFERMSNHIMLRGVIVIFSVVAAISAFVFGLLSIDSEILTKNPIVTFAILAAIAVLLAVIGTKSKHPSN